MSVAVLHYSTSCYVTGGGFEETRKLLAFFEHVPLFIFIFHLALGIYLKDIYFFVSNTVAQVLVFYYFLALSDAIRSDRPPIFDYVLCQKPRYGVPDGLYIATISYVIVMAYGLAYIPQIYDRISFLYKAGVIIIPVLYTLALLVNQYFYFWQFVINLALAIATSTSYLYVYWKFFGEYRILRSSRHWLMNTIGMDTELFSQQPKQNDYVQPKDR